MTMLIGQHPGQAYEGYDGRLYYDTTDGTTYRTGAHGFGLYIWRRSGQSARWEQIRGTTQWRPLSLSAFRARMSRQFGP
jgi:hypothetical protein